MLLPHPPGHPMRLLHALLTSVLLFSARAAQAQETDYVPAHTLVDGRQIVAVYLGASTCVPCLRPEVKAAVRSMKSLVAAQARLRGASFAAIGVANDWSPATGMTFLEPLGAFDQLVIGGNWMNVAIERFLLRDRESELSMPQVLIVERTVRLGDRVTISEPIVIHRVIGGDAIPAWVAAGAPLPAHSGKQQR